MALGDKVVFESIDTSDRDVFLEWGISDGIYVEGVKISNGPPLVYEKIVKILAKKVNKLK